MGWPPHEMLRRGEYKGCSPQNVIVNANVFLHAYQARMPAQTGYRGWHAQEYHLWRTGWLIACLDQLGDAPYHHQSGAEREARKYLGKTLRDLDHANRLQAGRPYANSVSGLRELL